MAVGSQIDWDEISQLGGSCPKWQRGLGRQWQSEAWDTCFIRDAISQHDKSPLEVGSQFLHVVKGWLAQEQGLGACPGGPWVSCVNNRRESMPPTD